VILYEYPLNERVRTYLRLEHLFARLGQLLARESSLDHHYALVTIFEVIEVASRSELKSDVLKDLEKHKQLMAAYRGNPAISEQALDEVLSQIEEAFANFNAQNGKPGSPLADNEWVTSIRSRIAIPAGTCEFDLPAYYLWQHKLPEQRRTDIMRWASSLWPLAQAITLLLKMLRDTGSAQKIMAVGGHHQQNLPSGRSFQLLRLRVPSEVDLIPEISGNRLMFSIRFLAPSSEDKMPSASTDDVSFELSLCN
jgi:cell division protein ZapD